MILFGCDLQQAKSSEMPRPLGWNTSTNLPSAYHSATRDSIQNSSFVFSPAGFFWLSGLFFSSPPPHGIFFLNSIMCLYSANQSALQKYHYTIAIDEYVSTEAEADFLIYSYAKDIVFCSVLCGTMRLNNMQLSFHDDERHTR